MLVIINKQDELINLTVISKAVNKDCKQPGIEWRIIHLFVLSPKRSIEDGGSTRDFFQNLKQYQQDENTNNKLQRYRLFRVNHVDKFDGSPFPEFGEFLEWIAENNIRMEGIRILNMSLLSSTTTTTTKIDFMNASLPKALSRIMPNLCELDLSNTYIRRFRHILLKFSKNCPRLEKVTWNNIPSTNFMRVDPSNNFMRVDGTDMEFSINLREISMDNSVFNHYLQDENEMSDLINHPNTFLFHKCCTKVLERVSIRNAKLAPFLSPDPKDISQDMLIKFIRNVPFSMHWFRSDLTQENIALLQKERPDIEF